MELALTDAVVPQVPSQALSLVLWVVVPLPLLELLARQILVLRLPLGTGTESECCYDDHKFQADEELTGFLH